MLGTPARGAMPTPVEVNQLVALLNAGRYIELENHALFLLEQYPYFGIGWNALGISLHVQGKDAVPALQKATEFLPDDAAAHNTLGSSLQARGQFDSAVASYRRALKIDPGYPEAHNNLGSALQMLGQLHNGVASYRRALELNPKYAVAHNNLGHALQVLGQIDSAVASFRRAVELNPDYAKAHNNLGNALQVRGQLDSAVASFRRALEIDPHFALAHSNLGSALQLLGQLDDAAASYRSALELNPGYAEAHSNLGSVLQALGRLDDAVASYRRALELNPGFAEAHSNLGFALRGLGQVDSALASCRRALELKPDYATVHSTLLFILSENTAVDAAMLFAEHCRFAEHFEAPLRASWPRHANPNAPDRPLRIGFVSGDLRVHAVASFFEPILAYLSSCPELSLSAYANHSVDDGTSRRLRGYFAHWHSIHQLSDAALADEIRADGIDILFDLSGHTSGNRLLTFARKPAPVQASWMGYPGTTGLQGMDYYLADRSFLPHAQFASQFTEKLLYLPASAPFSPSKEAPAVNELPALRHGHVTFGSFNRPSKISRAVVAMWSQVLRAVPDSRMLLGAMPEVGKYDTLTDWFAQEGIARERLAFHANCDMEAYLELHHQVDICLDTFPYNGGTTTLHALWMGVPTLTLAGNTAPGRTGASILGHVGLDAFVAHDAGEFLRKGVSLAGNLAGLSDIRAGLRARFAQSAMGQPELVAEGLRRALRIMWRRWCAALPAESFEITRQEIDNAAWEAGSEKMTG